MIAVADQARDAFVVLANNLEAAGNDCSKATAAVRASDEVAKGFQSDAEKLQAQIARDAAAEDWFKQRYSDLATVANTRIKPMVDACISDPAFAKAWEENLLMPRKKRGAVAP